MSDDIKIKVGVQSNAKAGMTQAQKDIEGGTNKIKSGVSNTLKGMAGAFGFAAIAMGVRSLIKEVGDLQDLAEQVEFSPEAFQKLKIAAENSGSGVEKLEVSLGKLAKARTEIGSDEKTQKAFKALGLSVEEVLKSNPQDLFEKIAAGFAKTGDRAALFDLFGKGAAKLIPTLRELADGFDAVHAKGQLIDENEINKMDRLDKQLNGITRTLKSWGTSAITGVVGFIEQVASVAGTASAGGSAAEALQNATTDPSAEKQKKEDAANKKALDEIEANRQREKFKITEEIKTAKEAIEEKQNAIAEIQDTAFEKDKRMGAVQEELNKREGFGGGFGSIAARLTGQKDMTLAEKSDDEMKRLSDRDYDRQQKDLEKESKRMKRRLELREKMFANKNLKGGFAERVRAANQMALDVEGKRDFITDYQKLIQKLQEDQRDALQDIKKDTQGLKALEKLLTMK